MVMFVFILSGYPGADMKSINDIHALTLVIISRIRYTQIFMVKHVMSSLELR